MDLKKISDDQLWNQTRALAADERRITLDVLLHLKEVDRRNLHLKRGFPSLYEYAVRELKYSEGAAYRRVQAMRLLRELPEVEKKIQTGELTITTAAKVQTAARNLTKAQKEEVLIAVAGKSSREVEQKLTQWKTSSSREFARWVSPEEVQLAVLLDKGSFNGLSELKAIKSHSTPTFSKLVKDLVRLGHEKWNPMQRIAPSAQRSYAQKSNSNHISAEIRRLVWVRDRGRCSFVDPQTSQRCESTHFVQIDHILPLALGGKSTEGNLRLLCAQHNQHRAERTFGPKPSTT